jgi:glycosyltransferase involved in cell wall biosynthesis
VLVLASKPWGLAPGQRFRIEQWAPWLELEHQIHVVLVPFESDRLSKILYRPGHLVQKAAWIAYDFARRVRTMIGVRGYDAVIIFREASLIGPALYERWVASTRVPVIYDFDDAIWMRQPGVKASIFSALHFYSKTSTICRIATAVTAGNSYLAAYARHQNPNVHVIPTSIETNDYKLDPEPPERPFVVCWTGSTSTLVHFELARAPLEQLAARIPLVVKVICNRPPERPIEGAEMRFVPWSAETEAAEIADCHAGIMPLPDDEFSRGKCGLKALQYMAAGRPVVVSPVGVNREIVQHGQNGFIASSTEEFVTSLTQLANDPELRERMGREARRTVERDYSAREVARRFAEVVRSVAA